MSSDGLQDAPSAEFQEDSYVSRPGEKDQPIPVQSDGDRVEDPIDGEQADTDAQLERDDKDAINEQHHQGAHPRCCSAQQYLPRAW
ncbi:hypothetical protein IL306_013456 [Fusarium sp. DS 682]|nr:hypothetical protein IL306_013456 [Fusarium sp. DS 682]